MFGSEVTVYSTFDAVEDAVIEQAHEGVRSMGQAVLEDAKGSMKFGGLPKNRYRGGFYESAAEGEPPRYHSRTFIDSIDMALVGGRAIVGSKSSEVAQRGAWFEFGGRPLEPDEKGRKRNRKYKLHPWLGPALDRKFDTFVPRVIGTLTH